MKPGSPEQRTTFTLLTYTPWPIHFCNLQVKNFFWGNSASQGQGLLSWSAVLVKSSDESSTLGWSRSFSSYSESMLVQADQSDSKSHAEHLLRHSWNSCAPHFNKRRHNAGGWHGNTETRQHITGPEPKWKEDSLSHWQRTRLYIYTNCLSLWSNKACQDDSDTSLYISDQIILLFTLYWSFHPTTVT